MLISAVQPAQVSEIGSDAIYSLCISETIKTILAIVVNVAYKLSIKAHTWLCYFVELKSVQDMMNRSKSVHQITLLEVYRCVSHLHWSNSNAVLWLRKKMHTHKTGGKPMSLVYIGPTCAIASDTNVIFFCIAPYHQLSTLGRCISRTATNAWKLISLNLNYKSLTETETT